MNDYDKETAEYELRVFLNAQRLVYIEHYTDTIKSEYNKLKQKFISQGYETNTACNQALVALQGTEWQKLVEIICTMYNIPEQDRLYYSYTIRQWCVDTLEKGGD